MSTEFCFHTAVFPKDPLVRFAREARRALIDNPIELHYPEAVRRKHSLEKWVQVVPEIRRINAARLLPMRGRAGVYGVFVAQGKQDWILKYVGTANGSGSVQRLRNHLFWRNRKTPSGRFTNCKFEEVRAALQKRCLLAFSFVEVDPAGIRHFVESYIQSRDNPEWNLHGTAPR